MGFWERTWKERSDEIYRAYGETSPPSVVHPFSWDEIRCPGACGLVLPPTEAQRDPHRSRRDAWLYLSLGLSQPLNKKQVEKQRTAGNKYSACGIEFAFLTPRESPWAIEALYAFTTYMTEGETISWGHRFPFGFQHRDGETRIFAGNISGTDIQPIGAIRAVLFWPFLFPESTFVTSTGKFLVLMATGITAAEWQLAKDTTTEHLLLLLCRAGIGQRTLVDRGLLDEPRWRAEWEQIAKMPPEACEAELKTGIGKWL